MVDEPRYSATAGQNAVIGTVRWSPAKSLWIGTMMLIAIIGGYHTFSVENFAVLLITTAITLCFGHSLGMHRLFIHNSYQTYKPVEYIFVWLGVLVGIAGPIGMMRTHDIRDWAQRQRQCHDYFAHRQVWYRDLWWQLHCDVKLDNPPEFTPEDEVENNKVYRFMESTWMLQQLPLVALLYAAGGWEWVIWGSSARISISVFGHWLIGYFAHNTGEQEWHVSGASVQGYNIKFCGLITMGECWHNNHHAFPGSAKLGIHDSQTDPGWWVLKLMQYLGWAWDLKTPKDLGNRKELLKLECIDNYMMTALVFSPLLIRK